MQRPLCRVAVSGRVGAEPGAGAAARCDRGRSAIAVAFSLSEAARRSVRYSSVSCGGLGPLADPIAWITPARIVGDRWATAR